ncbi:hypothetical protein Zmor_011661 [Zophobas morio]|uniref:Peptidase S1 domain-containing protein n=1 Tax=Zophobas morio TaxID=2755281 RepID=A0AA38IRD0_9CUCU|nr:hypothetical protein Zmor_011661 [Zophobas morio]
MKSAIIILILIVLVAAAPKRTKLGYRNLYKEPVVPIVDKPNPRIIGGQEAVPHSIPYQAFIEIYTYKDGWYCGGSLLTPNYVVTAAHCGLDGEEAYVTLGAHNIINYEDTQIEDHTTDITIHAEYDGEKFINDIGVIRLSQPVTLTEAITTVKLPAADAGDFSKTTGRASGWGVTVGSSTDLSEVLMYVDLEVITKEKCEEGFGDLLDGPLLDSIVCTSGQDNTGVCSGDSGGPLIVDGTLVGITSFGVRDCPFGYPSAYTRVTSFLDWLAENSDVTLQ